MNISETTLYARDLLSKLPRSQKGIGRASVQNCIAEDVKDGLLSLDEAAMFLAACGCYGVKGKAILKEIGGGG
jgi:hypothetical protein